jgi:peptidoglycan/LPS O-acetylase OafA/YrhL
VTVPLQVLGKYNFSICLTHQALNLFLARHFWDGMPNAGTAIYRLAVILGTDALVALGVGWLTWHVLEKHALRLKDRFQPLAAC